MKKILSYLPFAGSLGITITMIFVYSLTGSLGNLALTVPCIISTVLTHEMIED